MDMLDTAGPSAIKGAKIACWVAAAFIIAVLACVAPPLAFLTIALAVVVLCTRCIPLLAVFTFWTLPYMVVNLPTGGITLQLTEVVAYLFSGAVVARAVLRKEWLALPPATVPVLGYLAVQLLAAAFSPVVPIPYLSDFGPTDTNGWEFRSYRLIIWEGVAWLVVVALYHTLSRNAGLYWKCVRVHILSGGVASAISLGLYGLGLCGVNLVNTASGGKERSITPLSTGDKVRLAGVAYEPAMLAFYLLSVLPVTLCAFLYYPQWISRKITGTVLALQMTVMLFTFSTSGWIGLAISLACLAPTLRRLRVTPSIRRKLAGLATAIVLVVGLGIVTGQYVDKFTSTFAKLAPGGDQARAVANQEAWAVFADYPILGVGPGMPGFWAPRYDPAIQSQTLGSVPAVTNMYLATLAESGALGLMALALCGIVGLAALLKPLIRYGPARAPILMGHVAGLLAYPFVFLGAGTLILNYFSVAIGLAVVAAKLAEAGMVEPPTR